MNKCLSEFLDTFRKPQKANEVVKNLPCEICSKKHGWIISRKWKNIFVWELHSPCLDGISEQAVNVISKVLKERR